MNEIAMKKEECPECGLKFSTKGNLTRHLKNKRCKTKDILKNKSAINLEEDEKNKQLEIQRQQEEEMRMKEQEEAEILRLEQEKQQQIEAEILRLKEEKIQQEEDERLRLEEEKRQQEEQERLQKEAEIRQREEEKRQRREQERIRLEEEQRAREEQERLRLEAEMRRKEEEERLRIQEELRIKEEQEKIREEQEREQKRREQIEEKNRIEKEKRRKNTLNTIEENLKMKVERQHKEMENEVKEIKNRLEYYENEMKNLKERYDDKLETIHEREKQVIRILEDDNTSDDDYLKGQHYINNLLSLKKKVESEYGKELNELKKLYEETIQDKEVAITMRNELVDISHTIQRNKLAKMDTFQETLFYMNQLSKKNEAKKQGISFRNKTYKNRKIIKIGVKENVSKPKNRIDMMREKLQNKTFHTPKKEIPKIFYPNLTEVSKDFKETEGIVSINGNRSHNKTMKNSFRRINITS